MTQEMEKQPYSLNIFGCPHCTGDHSLQLVPSPGDNMIYSASCPETNNPIRFHVESFPGWVTDVKVSPPCDAISLLKKLNPFSR